MPNLVDEQHYALTTQGVNMRKYALQITFTNSNQMTNFEALIIECKIQWPFKQLKYSRMPS